MSLKSTVVGGVSYQRIDLDTGAPIVSGDKTEVTRWETKRVIEDKTEHDAAVKARSNALGLIRKVCSVTSFGLLCPADQEGALDAAVAQAHALVDTHNQIATHTRVGIYALKGRVASDDAEAARAITSEVASLVQQMDAGIKAFDPKVVRDAANRARELSGMLSEEKQGKLEGAIAQARAAARAIVKRVEKEGEDRSLVLMDIQRSQIESARIAFLDLSGGDDVSVAPSSSIDQQRFADLDVEDPGVRVGNPATARARELEIES